MYTIHIGTYRNSFVFIAKRFHIIPLPRAVRHTRTRSIQTHTFYLQQTGIPCTARRTLKFDRKVIFLYARTHTHTRIKCNYTQSGLARSAYNNSIIFLTRN